MPPFRQKIKNMEITEEMMRDIFKCPKGFVIQRIDCNEAYEIQANGCVENLKDFTDNMTYVSFIDFMEDEDYIICPTQEQVEEMTLEEVCKALGKTIKIVRG